MQKWIRKIFSKNDAELESDSERTLERDETLGSAAHTVSTQAPSKTIWSSAQRKTGVPRLMPDTLEKATVDYILNKYKKEAYRIMTGHIEQSGIEGVSEERIKEVKTFLAAVLQIVEDDFFIGYRLLKNRMIKIESYLFSQYRKDPALKPNIYALLLFAQNKRFSTNLKENLTAYFAVIEEMNFEIIQFLEDYYVILEDLEKNPKTTVYLKKDYGIKSYIKIQDDSNSAQSERTIDFFRASMPSDRNIVITEHDGAPNHSNVDKDKNINKDVNTSEGGAVSVRGENKNTATNQSLTPNVNSNINSNVKTAASSTSNTSSVSAAPSTTQKSTPTPPTGVNTANVSIKPNPNALYHKPPPPIQVEGLDLDEPMV